MSQWQHSPSFTSLYESETNSHSFTDGWFYSRYAKFITVLICFLFFKWNKAYIYILFLMLSVFSCSLYWLLALRETNKKDDGNDESESTADDEQSVSQISLREEEINIFSNESVMIVIKCKKDILKQPATNNDVVRTSLSLFSRIKVKPFECQVHFQSVAIDHPPQINKIPWSYMNQEWWRLHTFSKYPRNAPCSSIRLARNGFVYIGSGDQDDDTVLCVFCLSAVRNLDSTMDIDEVHHDLKPDCPIVRNLACGNMPVKEFKNEDTIELFKRLLSPISKVKDSTNSDEQQFEHQSLPLESDGPQVQIDSERNSEESNYHDMPDAGPNVGNAVSVPPAPVISSDASLPNTNSSLQIIQETHESNCNYFVVTNHAQSLSLPNSGSSDSTDHPGDAFLTRPDASATSAAQASAGQSLAAQASAAQSSAKPDSNSNRSSLSGNNNISSIGNQQATSDGSRPSLQTDSTSHPAETMSDSRNTQPPQADADGVVATNSSQTSPDNGSQTATSYENLGIITSRPKRHEYAVEVTRLQSFEGWPQNHHILPVDLAKAGYFYTGYSDCARCFYCGGGLRNWEDGDDVWVEHARWFPKCAFMRQYVGQPFIDVVQDLNKEREMIPFSDVVLEMKIRGLESAIPKDIKNKSAELERDAAVKTIIDAGFMPNDVISAAEKVKETGQLLAADAIYEELVSRKVGRISGAAKRNSDSQSFRKKKSRKKDKATIDSLKSENSQLRQQSQCKICMDKEVAVVFLPCGHYISCNDCSFALKGCPVCRESIKGVVRAHLS